MITVRPLAIPEVLEITPDRFGDARGFFSETYKRSAWAAAGIDLDFIQDNHSFSAAPFTLRGFHLQAPPNAVDKLVRVGRGRAWDVAVDMRQGAPSFGRWVGVELSAEQGNQVLVPKGFAHAVLTLEPDTEVLYKMSGEYAPADEFGVRWDDRDIGVPWPLEGATPVLLERDAGLPRLAEIDSPFVYRA